jgi:hypothetical protein
MHRPASEDAGNEQGRRRMSEAGSKAMSPQRIDLNNTAIDQTAAAAGLCAAVHMPTGRMCFLPARHRGGCQFVVSADPVPQGYETHETRRVVTQSGPARPLRTPQVPPLYGSHPVLRDWSSYD